MAQDIKKLFENAPEMVVKELPKDHVNRFESRLNQEFTKEKSSFSFLKIAASIVLIMSLGLSTYYFFPYDNSSDKINTMADISPDLKKVEDYYLTHINYQIAKIKRTDENSGFLDAYFVQLGKLQEKYNQSIATLNTDEISEETIDALIENLQTRLKLIYQLKAQLKKIENLNKQKNENNEA